MIAASALLVSLAGCSSTYEPPEGTSPECVREIRGSHDAVWSACVEAFARRTTPIKTIEKDSGIIAAELQVAGPRDWASYVDLGKIDGKPVSETVVGRWTSCTLTFNVFVRPAGPAASTVRLTARWNGSLYFQHAWTGHWEPVGSLRSISTGVFENEFLGEIEKLVGAR